MQGLRGIQLSYLGFMLSFNSLRGLTSLKQGLIGLKPGLIGLKPGVIRLKLGL